MTPLQIKAGGLQAAAHKGQEEEEPRVHGEHYVLRENKHFQPKH